MNRGEDFAHIVYTLLVVERQRTVEEAAVGLGMSYASLHSRVIARRPFSADEIRGLIKFLPDARLVSSLLDGSDFVVAERVVPAGEQAQASTTVQRGATKVVVEAANILELVDALLAGGGLDHRHKRLLLGDIVDAERALATLRLQIEDP
jgi:hypothetical protein